LRDTIGIVVLSSETTKSQCKARSTWVLVLGVDEGEVLQKVARGVVSRSSGVLGVEGAGEQSLRG